MGSGVGSKGVVVTIDGPAGSGKSTTAKAVAEALGYRHLDSGALYRGITFVLCQVQGDIDDLNELTENEIADLDVVVYWSVHGIGIQWRGEAIPDRELRTPMVTSRVSQVAAWPGIRAWLLAAQREAGREGGLVTDGRDMGTVVFPDAKVKIFLGAEVLERARRRLGDKGFVEATDDEVEIEADRLEKRDALDSGREVAPLKAADDAVRLDTTRLDFIDQVEQVVGLVRKAVEEG